MRSKLRFRTVALVVFLLLFAAPGLLAQRTQVKPGIDKYSPEQDIEFGRQAAQEVERKLPMCNDPKVDAYLTELGHRLIEHLNTRGVEYPWEFHCVNDKGVNAFALPGGFVFINRGAIEASDNEAQLAAVMAHELAHVALRHGTNQATKAQYAQLGGGIIGAAGSLLGGVAGAAAAGAGQLTFGSVLLHYSRGAETQADIVGTQVLYDSGYDPRAMAAFFENLNASAQGGKAPPEFFSDHPNPDHRIERVDAEIRKLGGAPPGAQKDSSEFEAIKREVMALPPALKIRPVPAGAKPGKTPPANVPKPEDASANVAQLRYAKATLSYPDNWRNYTKKNNVALVPSGGVVNSSNGGRVLAWGIIAGLVKGKGANSADHLRDNTQKLIAALQKQNDAMEVETGPSATNVGGQPAISTYLNNDSPAGGTERDWLVNAAGPDGLYYYVFVCPDSDYPRFKPVFEGIVGSIHFQK
jgi:beta-barrel assembly-enhancing protease